MNLQQPPPTQNKKNDSGVKSTGPVTWSIRGVERDARAVIGKAAERLGKALGQYVNEDKRSLAQGQLTHPNCQRLPKLLRTRLTS